MSFISENSTFSSLNSIQKKDLTIFYEELLCFKNLFLTKKQPEKELKNLIQDGVLSGLLFLKKVPEGDLADVGSGAGFPGILLSILDRKRKLSLIEPKEDRAEFLTHLIQNFGFQDRVKVCKKTFGRLTEKIVTFKAFLPLKETLKQAKKYLDPEASSYHFKSESYQKEWKKLCEKERKLWKLQIFGRYKFQNKNRYIIKINRLDLI